MDLSLGGLSAGGEVGSGRVPPRAARVAGALSLVLWIGIVLSGRMIAYNWFDCDRQPQPAIVNFLTSCVPNASSEPDVATGLLPLV